MKPVIGGKIGYPVISFQSVICQVEQGYRVYGEVSACVFSVLAVFDVNRLGGIKCCGKIRDPIIGDAVVVNSSAYIKLKAQVIIEE